MQRIIYKLVVYRPFGNEKNEKKNRKSILTMKLFSTKHNKNRVLVTDWQEVVERTTTLRNVWNRTEPNNLS